MLSDSDWQVRAGGSTALGHLGQGQPHAIDALLSLLSDSNVFVRRDAVIALGKVGQGQPHVIDALLSLLSASNFDICQEANDRLGKWDRTSLMSSTPCSLCFLQPTGKFARRLQPHLEKWDRTSLMSSTPCFLCSLIHPQCSPGCCDRSWASGTGPASCHRRLALSAFCTDWQVRQAAATALGKVGQGQPHVIDALLPLLSDPSFSVRRETADRSWAKWERPASCHRCFALSAFCLRLRYLRAAATALGQVGQGQPHVIDTLLLLLSDFDWHVRREAATALGQVGQGQPHVIDALLPLLSDSEWKFAGCCDRFRSKSNKANHRPSMLCFLCSLTPSGIFVRRQLVLLGKWDRVSLMSSMLLLPLLSDFDWQVRQALPPL